MADRETLPGLPLRHGQIAAHQLQARVPVEGVAPETDRVAELAALHLDSTHSHSRAQLRGIELQGTAVERNACAGKGPGKVESGRIRIGDLLTIAGYGGAI